VSINPDSFYAQWRVQCGAAPLLREDQDSPPERLLQAIWQHQRLLRDQLRTLDGQAVQVLHPGFQSLEGGPDFRGAVIQLGEEPPRSGDVEVDVRSSGWRAHGHDRNPSFKNVLLHVVWECERPASGTPPAMPLRAALDAPLGELSLWLGGESIPALPTDQRGRCCAAIMSLSRDRLLELLHQAAAVRLRSKAAQFDARARQAGWEQSLWEGLFRALGYRHNIWPMQRLAELRPLWLNEAPDGLAVQARLMGLSALLPVDVARIEPGADGYLRRIWDLWWRDRDACSEEILPRSLWRLHGLRPANHPQRRLALASAWATSTQLPARLEHWCAPERPTRGLAASLFKVLEVAPDAFWSWHWTWRSARLERAHPLLGPDRVTDLAMNVILPWLWSRAAEGKNPALQERLEGYYMEWPPAQDNSVLRLARQRLLGTTQRRVLPDAAAQQGLLQVVRDFCSQSNAICEGCKLPGIVRTFDTSNTTSSTVG
jgi:hypothetical protein